MGTAGTVWRSSDQGKYMKRIFRRSPSPALAISIVALVLAASGTAVAASKLVTGNGLIKVNSLSGNRLKSGSVTAKQIALSTLGTVTSAVKATSASSAVTATTATTANKATTAGSAPIANVTYVTQTGTVQPNFPIATVSASCPSGTTVIGGGATIADLVNGQMIDSYPNGKTGWTADMYTSSSTGTTGTVIAICAPAAATTAT
jgi:hypothetical protein